MIPGRSATRGTTLELANVQDDIVLAGGTASVCVRGHHHTRGGELPVDGSFPIRA